MDRAQLPLNALRAFETAARHLNFTRAAIELCVGQGAVSHQVAQLEQRLGTPLFRRLPRGLALTDEGHALVPVVTDAFDRMGAMLDRFADGRMREVLTVGTVGTFASGWLLARIGDFTRTCPHVDLRLMTNNNRVDLAGEGLDFAIRFGDGAWHGTRADHLMDAPLTPLCTPEAAARIAGDPGRLAQEPLLRSYRVDEWPRWFAAIDHRCPPLRGTVFDSSVPMVKAAMAGQGIALAPALMFGPELRAGDLVRPFRTDIVTGGYWLTSLKSRDESPVMREFREWLTSQCAEATERI